MRRKKAKKAFIKKRDYNRIIIDIQSSDGEYASYTGKYEDFGLEFEGVTLSTGGELYIREILARMLTRRKELPEQIRSVIILIVGYLELMIKQGVKQVSTGAWVEFMENYELGLKVTVKFSEEVGEEGSGYKGWVATLRAIFYGFDGVASDSVHEVKKKLQLGEEPDFDLLRKELTFLAVIAYNAHRIKPMVEP